MCARELHGTSFGGTNTFEPVLQYCVILREVKLQGKGYSKVQQLLTSVVGDPRHDHVGAEHVAVR